MILAWLAAGAHAACALAPVATAPAPGSDAGTPCLAVDLDVAGRLFARFPDTGLSRGAQLPRLRAEGAWRDEGATVRAAVVPARSGGADGYVGIEGEALVPVLQIAEARYDLRDLGLSAAAGLVDDVALMPVQAAWQRLDVARPLGTDRGWLARSDLGGWLGWTAPEDRVSLTVSVVSGEGANRRERNRGLDTTAVLTVRPLSERRLELMVWGREGSTGLLQARDHRAGGAALFRHDVVVAGVEAILGWGLGGDGALRPGGASVWARTGDTVPFVGWARIDQGTDARGVVQTGESTFLVGGGPRLPPGPSGPAWIGVGYEGRATQPNAAPVAGATGTARTHTVYVQLATHLRGGVARMEAP